MTANPRADARVGYHSWPADGGGFVGSFEVFWHDGKPAENFGDAGWYWWPCFPGCLPDADEPSGPFDTSSLAFVDAMEQEG